VTAIGAGRLNHGTACTKSNWGKKRIPHRLSEQWKWFICSSEAQYPLLKIHDLKSVIQTPNIDRLAATGVVFDSAYCNSPLCAPSRFCLVTGCLPSKVGAYDNASHLNADIPTYAHYLRREGYETTLAGKMHFIGPDQLHGFENRLTPDIYPGDFGE
jgi:arylsulfatase A-like enzyme